MKTLRTLSLAAALVLGGVGAVVAAPLSVAPLSETAIGTVSGDALLGTQATVEKAAWVCGPFRCFHRPIYRRYWGWHRPWGWHRRWGWRRW